nr:RNA-binding protein FUS isoform X1 [Ipomoea batatas]
MEWEKGELAELGLQAILRFQIVLSYLFPDSIFEILPFSGRKFIAFLNSEEERPAQPGIAEPYSRTRDSTSIPDPHGSLNLLSDKRQSKHALRNRGIRLLRLIMLREATSRCKTTTSQLGIWNKVALDLVTWEVVLVLNHGREALEVLINERAEARPDLINNKSMIKDPMGWWEQLQPTIWKKSKILALKAIDTPDSHKSWLSKFVSTSKKARFCRKSESEVIASQQSLGLKYLAATLSF